MAKKVHLSPKAPKPIGPYSQAIEANGFVFFAGMIPLDPATGEIVKGDVTAQAKRVMENISALIETTDLTFENIVKTTIYLTDMNDFNAVNEVYGQHFKAAPPARTTIAVAGLPRGAKVEIEVIACRN
jgi:2-iminobutanoate/2-iminopropanoate deaminase